MNHKQVMIKQEFVQQKNIENDYYVFKIQKKVKEGVQQFNTTGLWSEIEKAKYAAFLIQHSKDLDKKCSKKTWNLFKDMSIFVKTRNFLQCKNYHQKLFKQYLSVPAILQYLSTSSPQFQFYLYGAQAELNDVKNLQKIDTQQNNRKVQTKFVNGDIGKENKDNDDGRPTGTSYDQQDVLPFEHEWQNPPQIPKFHPPLFFPQRFPQTPFVIKDLSNEQHHLKFRDPRFLQTREEEWRECHELFLLWMNKLQQLIQLRI